MPGSNCTFYHFVFLTYSKIPGLDNPPSAVVLLLKSLAVSDFCYLYWMCLLQNRKPLTVEEMYEDMSQVKSVVFEISYSLLICLETTQEAQAQIIILDVQTVVRFHKSHCVRICMYGKSSSTLKQCLEG